MPCSVASCSDGKPPIGVTGGHAVFLACVTMLVALVGCDTLSRRQFHVRPSSNGASAAAEVTSADVEDAERILALTAEKFNLVRVAEGKAPAFYREDNEPFPYMVAAYEDPGIVSFGRWIVLRKMGDLLLIDIEQFHPGSGETLVFKSLAEHVEGRLDARFGARFIKRVHFYMPLRPYGETRTAR